MEDSIPKPADIRFYVAALVPAGQRLCLDLPAIRCAILNHGIIEREECVMKLMCVYTMLAALAEPVSAILREILIGIVVESLTTILVPCTFLYRANLL